MKNEKKKKKVAKQDLLVIDAETGLLSHPSTLECVSPNFGILFLNLFGASSERITLIKSAYAGIPRQGHNNTDMLYLLQY